MTTADERPLPAPDIHATKAMTFVCVFGRCALDALQHIPALWRQFMPFYAEIDHIIDPIPVGVLGPIDEDGRFHYGCAVQVDASSTPPKGMTLLRMPAQQYAVFRHDEHVSTIRGTYDTIWNRALPEHGWTMPDQPGLERHDPTFDPLTGHGGITIWVPVARKG
jgi:AraC family transcriptional regulator